MSRFITHLKQIVLASLFSLLCAKASSDTGVLLDTLVLGDSTSEQSHNLVGVRSKIIEGGLGETARELLPLEPASHNGGSISFDMQVDPDAQNYLTVKLWGSDHGEERGRLILYINDEQVGYRHEGDHDVLNQMDADPLYQDRFVYQTVALPTSHTQGNDKVELKIQGIGRMWPYGNTFEKKQRKLEEPSRGIYRVYTHTNTRFSPPADEVQGEPQTGQTRPAGEGEAILEDMRKTVIGRLNRLINDPSQTKDFNRSTEGKILLLSQAYNTPWTPAYHNPKTIAAIVRLGDSYFTPGAIGNWIGAGPLGEAIMYVGEAPLNEALDEVITVRSDMPVIGKAKESEDASMMKMTRREAWARVLRASVDWTRMHGRRSYTNQSMIVDLNIYTANEGLRLIDPALALPEEQVLRYVYESMGIEPWLGNDLADGGSEMPYGADYYLFTEKGLSKELGFVATYGETILYFGQKLAKLTGDEKVREQLLKFQKPRMYFRYPSLDADGFRSMKLASEIDTRTAHFPLKNAAYGVADVREAWWMELPAYLQDPVSVGATQQAMADNQYFPRLAQRKRDGDTLGMMHNIDDYETFKNLPLSEYRLPMTPGQPDFTFVDEENAVIALKHEEQILYLVFYFRQEFGVSGVVRILDITPETMRIASVIADFKVNDPQGEWTRPDVIDFQRWGGFNPPDEEIHQAWLGEKLPIAKRPDDATQPTYGEWGPFVGKASFYSLRYGDYLIGINTTEDQTYILDTPAGSTTAEELVSGEVIDLNKPVSIGPRSSAILYLPSADTADN